MAGDNYWSTAGRAIRLVRPRLHFLPWNMSPSGEKIFYMEHFICVDL